MQEDRVLLGVSFDISNAFNTLSWDREGETLQDQGFSPYLKRILRDYFSSR